MTRQWWAPVAARQAPASLAELVSKLAVAKHELGFRCAFWAGRGPSVDASIALAGLALEEEGHAKVLEGFAADELGGEPVDRDALVRWDLWPSVTDTTEYRREAWPESLLRYFLQDVETTAALQALSRSPQTRLADRARKMVEEEQFHALFAMETLRTIADISPDARLRLQSQFDQLQEELRHGGGFSQQLAELTAARHLPEGTLETHCRYRDEHIAEAAAMLAASGAK